MMKFLPNKMSINTDGEVKSIERTRTNQQLNNTEHQSQDKIKKKTKKNKKEIVWKTLFTVYIDAEKTKAKQNQNKIQTQNVNEWKENKWVNRNNHLCICVYVRFFCHFTVDVCEQLLFCKSTFWLQNNFHRNQKYSTWLIWLWFLIMFSCQCDWPEILTLKWNKLFRMTNDDIKVCVIFIFYTTKTDFDEIFVIQR